MGNLRVVFHLVRFVSSLRSHSAYWMSWFYFNRMALFVAHIFLSNPHFSPLSFCNSCDGFHLSLQHRMPPHLDHIIIRQPYFQRIHNTIIFLLFCRPFNFARYILTPDEICMNRFVRCVLYLCVAWICLRLLSVRSAHSAAFIITSHCAIT